MASPITPSQFAAVIPASNTTLGDAMLNGGLKFSLLWSEFFSWMYAADGTFSDAFKLAYCGARGVCSPPAT